MCFVSLLACRCSWHVLFGYFVLSFKSIKKKTVGDSLLYVCCVCFCWFVCVRGNAFLLLSVPAVFCVFV